MTLTFSASAPFRHVETPARLKIGVAAKSGKKAPGGKDAQTKVKVVLDASAMEPRAQVTAKWEYWSPGIAPLIPARRYWTRNYIGTDKAFYEEGYRWGVSLGGTPEAFKRSSLARPGGGINLPDGKYLIAIRKNAAGEQEVVLGKEDRGTDKRTLAAYQRGEKPVSNAQKEILGVSNHSMLISRGKPFAPEDLDAFSVAFAGEIEIVNHHINIINDQTGQIFGPNGLVKPPHEAQVPQDLVLKQPDYEPGKSTALKEARDLLGEITGDCGIRLVKVHFFNKGLSADDLKMPHRLKLKADADALTSALEDPYTQKLLDQLQNQPEDQLRVIAALPKNRDMLPAILDLQGKQVERGTMKPEQSAALAAELAVEPMAIGLFVPGSPYFMPGLSDNTKRKLVSAYNAWKGKDKPAFRDLILDLRSRQALMNFLGGQRTPGSMMRLVLRNPERANACAAMVRELNAAAGRARKATPFDLGGTDARIVGNVGTAGRMLRELEQKSRRKTTLLLLNNPFNGTILKPEAIRENIRHLRKLQAEGMQVYGNGNFASNRAYEYLIDLFAFAQPATDTQDASDRQDMDNLMQAYGVDTDRLYAFVRSRFASRWSNNQILMAYAMADKPFRHFLKDVTWSITLPLATH